MVDTVARGLAVGAIASRPLTASVPSLSGALLSLPSPLAGNVTFAKASGDANLTVSAAGVVSATTAIPVGAMQTIVATVTSEDGITASITAYLTGYAASITRVFGTVTTTKDGSVGQTYSAPVGMVRPQWFRETTDSAKTLTLIAGATGSTYTAVSGDVGYRLAVRGFMSGVLTLAVPYAVVLTAPTLMEAFDSTTGFTLTGSPTISADTTTKVQGTASLSLTSAGAAVTNVKKNGIGTYNPANLGTLAVYWNAGNDPEMMQYAGSKVRIDQSGGSYPTSGIIADGAQTVDSGNFKLNGYWDAMHVSESSYILGLSASSPLGVLAVGHDTTSPMNGTVKLDALLANAGGRPTVVIGFDDGLPGQYSIAAGQLEARGMRGTWYVPTALIDQAGKMTTANVLDLYARGHDMQIDGRSNDQFIIDLASEAAFTADLQAQKAWFAARGLPTPKHLCYPNGYFRGYNTAGQPNQGGTRVQLTGVARTSGSPNLTVSSNTGITVGMKVVGLGLPTTAPFARVSSISGTTITLDTNASSTGTGNVWFTNDNALFHTGRIQALMAAEGIVSGRATFIASGFSNVRLTRFGEAGQAMVYGATGVTGLNATQMIAALDKCLLRGGTLEFYFHDVVTGGNPDGSSANPDINVYAENLALFLDYIKSKVDAGLMDTLTRAQQYARDSGSGVPV